jgi:hypothetical protein
MLSPRQIVIARLAAKKSADPQVFDACIMDAVAGITPTDKQFRTIVDRALALSRSLSRRPLPARVGNDADGS